MEPNKRRPRFFIFVFLIATYVLRSLFLFAGSNNAVLVHSNEDVDPLAEDALGFFDGISQFSAHNFSMFDHLSRSHLLYRSPFEYDQTRRLYCSLSDTNCIRNPEWYEAITNRDSFESRMSRLKRNCGETVSIAWGSHAQNFWSHVLEPAAQELHTCPVKCTASFADTLTGGAEVDVTFNTISPFQYQDAVKAAITLERFDRPVYNDPMTMPTADILMSHHRSSDIWANYFYGFNTDFQRDSWFYNPKVRDSWGKMPERERVFGALFISNCVEHRAKYLLELSKYIKLLSFGIGDCFSGLRTDKAEDLACKMLGKYCENDWMLLPKAEQKRTVSALFPFFFAFENGISDDYMTEKFFEALSSGVIPVVRGSPTLPHYKDLFLVEGVKRLPWIDALDFGSPSELAEYLRKVVREEHLYKEYMSWIDKFNADVQYAETFRKAWNTYNLANTGSDSAFCHLCEFMRKYICADN